MNTEILCKCGHAIETHDITQALNVKCGGRDGQTRCNCQDFIRLRIFRNRQQIPPNANLDVYQALALWLRMQQSLRADSGQ